MTILIVDDESEICETLSALLSWRGYEIHSVPNGLRALESIRNTKFDLVMSDINMPKMNGVELLKTLTRERPELPVILMTGFMDYKIPELLALGAKAVLSKPFNSEELVKAVQKFASGT